jgi:hypothetical protein
MKHIIEMFQQGMNLKCGVKHFVAAKDNTAMRVTIQVRQIKKAHLCQQKLFLGGQL